LTRLLPHVSPFRLALPVYLAFPKSSVLFSLNNLLICCRADPKAWFRTKPFKGGLDGILARDVHCGLLVSIRLVAAVHAMEPILGASPRNQLCPQES